jgi:hypothetical protein
MYLLGFAGYQATLSSYQMLTEYQACESLRLISELLDSEKLLSVVKPCFMYCTSSMGKSTLNSKERSVARRDCLRQSYA